MNKQVRAAIVQALIDAQERNADLSRQLAAAKRDRDVCKRTLDEIQSSRRRQRRASRQGRKAIASELGRAILCRRWPNGEPMSDAVASQLERFIDPINSRLRGKYDAAFEWLDTDAIGWVARCRPLN